MPSKLPFLLFVFFIFSCFADETFQKADITFVSKKKNDKQVSIRVELAITHEQKMQGFMERKNIPEGTGMIFLYNSDEKLHFWMKNTPTPLSIAFISFDGKITEIKDLTPFSLETVSSTFSCRYALEVPLGMFSRLNIDVGDYINEKSLRHLRRSLAKFN